MKQAFRIFGILFIVVFVGGGVLAAHFLVPKKAFTVPRVAVDATVDSAGTMRVVEHISRRVAVMAILWLLIFLVASAGG